MQVQLRRRVEAHTQALLQRRGVAALPRPPAARAWCELKAPSGAMPPIRAALPAPKPATWSQPVAAPVYGKQHTGSGANCPTCGAVLTSMAAGARCLTAGMLLLLLPIAQLWALGERAGATWWGECAGACGCGAVLSLLSVNRRRHVFGFFCRLLPSTRSRVGEPNLREGFTKGGGLIDQQHCPSLPTPASRSLQPPTAGPAQRQPPQAWHAGQSVLLRGRHQAVRRLGGSEVGPGSGRGAWGWRSARGAQAAAVWDGGGRGGCRHRGRNVVRQGPERHHHGGAHQVEPGALRRSCKYHPRRFATACWLPLEF